MQISLKDKYVEPATALQMLQASNQIMPIYYDFDLMAYRITKYRLQLANLCTHAMEMLKVTREMNQITKQSELKPYIESMINAAPVLHGYFPLTTKGRSITDETVATFLASPYGEMSEDLADILRTYIQMGKLGRRITAIAKFMGFPLSRQMSWNNHRMVEIPLHYTMELTGRFGTENPSIYNVSHDLQDLWTCPKGWLPFHADSGQIEPRIIWNFILADPTMQALINLYNDAYYAIIHYSNLGPDELHNTNFTKLEITQELTDMRQAIKKTHNGAVYGRKAQETTPDWERRIIEIIQKHPARQLEVQKALQQFARGNTVIQTAFGRPIDCALSPKMQSDMGTSYAPEEFSKLYINYRTQGTAADFMNFSVAHGFQLCRSTKSCIAYYHHDAGYYYLHEDDYDKLYPELSEIVAYDVSEWPIRIGAEGGFATNTKEELFMPIETYL